jgi:serine/threonine-protein kinase
VALKILPADVAADLIRMRRFVQEAKAASALNHPNIITIHEIDQIDSLNFIATEFIDGETLQERIRAGMKPEDVLEVAIQVASALAAAHSASIIHRDIKPQNIMVRRDGYIKVLDFGLAKLTGALDSVTDSDASTMALVNTSAGTVMGTAVYMSPEQAKGAKVDERTDLWSLGAVIYEMMTGRVPFMGDSTPETISLILQKEPAPLTRYAREVPAEMERIVNKALTNSCEARYQSAKDLLIDLRNLKRKIEVDAEIDRTISPELRGTALTRSTDEGQNASATKPATSVTHASSSAEYSVASIKQHKLAALIVVLVLALAAVALSLYLRGGTVGASIDSIPVLPFENRSADPEAEYLSDGLVESLIYRLSQFPNLRVSPTSVVLRYKGKEADAMKVGNELGVSAVLVGRITQRGDNLTISAELVDVRNNKLLWGEQYDRKMSDLLATQREIARAIAEKLRLKVSGEEKVLAKNYTENNEAYRLYLKGRFHWARRNPESIEKAIEYFKQALEQDPTFALAYVGLADAYVVPANRLPPRVAMPKAKAAAMRALEIDDTLAEAHTSLARVQQVYDWDWKEAEKEYRRAIDLNPRYAVAHQWYGGYLERIGQIDQAISEKKLSLELDPLSAITTFELGQCYLFARDHDKALEQFQKALELEPNFPAALQYIPLAYVQKGMYEEAIAHIQSAPESAGLPITGSPGYVYAMAGRTQEARAMIEELKVLRGKQEYISPLGIASIYAGLGEKDEAIAWLEKGFEERAFQMQMLKMDPRWDKLRSDQRFTELVRRVGLTP